MNRKIVLAALCLALVVCGRLPGKDEKPPAKGAEVKVFHGHWVGKTLTFDGETVPEDVITKLKFTAEKEEITMIGGLAKMGDKFIPTARKDKFKLELGKDGTTLTIDLVEPGEGGRRIPGIYKFEKDQITICLNYKDKERPAKFESKEGTGIGLFVFEKMKKDD